MRGPGMLGNPLMSKANCLARPQRFKHFALILVAVLPAVKSTDPLAPSPGTHVRCPDCREFVYKDARTCKHCGIALIPQTPVRRNGMPRYLVALNGSNRLQ